MKYIFFFGLTIFSLTQAQAQKKTAPKSAGTNTTSATPAVQKTSGANTTPAQAVFIATGSPDAFKKLAGEARSNYDANKLDDSRFALQQMLAELDMIIGKEVLKALPANMMDKPAITKQDNVSGASGFLGVVIHREYGKEYSSSDNSENRNINLEIISNSPLISSINAMLSLPLIGNTGDNKVVKVAGYKALISKTSGYNDETNYELQMPLGNSLITVKAPGLSQEQVAQIANSLPIQEIVKMLQ
jgi:hypothetical protein